VTGCPRAHRAKCGRYELALGRTCDGRPAWARTAARPPPASGDDDDEGDEDELEFLLYHVLGPTRPRWYIAERSQFCSVARLARLQP